MTHQMQALRGIRFRPHPGGCNHMWEHAVMTSEEREREAAALAELDELTAAYQEAEEVLDRAREALQASIIKHLMERNAAPGKIAAHSPYDRNHIRRIGVQAGVPPLRGKTVRSAKTSD
ncbi:hypothetical protein [Streptomyces sp. 891-h]|uniref:hypothetical protein n=1 Tax=Streptomyces sp. 891-h TaxID=2720714 RepID=UPI001FA9B86E|nr:hypothetical protein [Streptomyces sp. 891-h]UNZ20601.1 hypothetical protein HC362_29595 [Streptomyces sp. 891-h]